MANRPEALGRGTPALAALLIAIAAAFTLGGYELVRSPTNTLYKAAYGKESLAVGMAGIPIAVAAIVYGYARLLSWLGARRTLFVTTVGSAMIIAGLQFAFERGITVATFFLFLFRSAYVVLLIEQYWSYMNSTFTSDQAKRFNGPVCGLASLGSIAGGIFGADLTNTLGTGAMVYVAALVTLPAAFVADYAFKRCGEPKGHASDRPEVSGHLALGLFRRHRLLLLLLGIVVATQVVAALLTLSFQGELSNAIPDADAQTTWSFTYFAWINGVAAVFQFFVAPLVMRRANPGVVQLMIPIVHIIALGVYLHQPMLITAAVAHGAFKCMDYSVFRAAKEILYLPLTFEARYRAKEVIDVFGYRFSKGFASGAVAILAKFGVAFTEVTHAIGALAATAVWVAFAAPLGKYFNQSLTADDVKPTSTGVA